MAQLLVPHLSDTLHIIHNETAHHDHTGEHNVPQKFTIILLQHKYFMVALCDYKL